MTTPTVKSAEIEYIEEVEVEKFNPYHDSRGRFSTANGAASFTYKPGASVAHDRAIEREKQRTAALDAAKPKAVAFTPAKTKKEAVEYAQNELGFEKVSYGTKMDIDTINFINQSITEVQAKYPETKGAVGELKTWRRENAYAAIETKRDGRMTLLVCPSQFGNGIDTVEKQYAQDVKTGYHPTGTKANSIIYHEYGHVLANISTKEGMGYAANDTFAGQYPTMSKYANNRISSTTEKAWVNGAVKSTGKTPIDRQ